MTPLVPRMIANVSVSMNYSCVRWQGRSVSSCLFVLLSFASAARAAPTACTPEEDVVFQCRTGKKVIAVCAARGVTEGLRYRFGPPTAAELTLSTDRANDGKVTVSGSDLAYSGGGGAYLRFRSDTTDYVVYTAVSSRWGEQSGVVAERGGKQLRGAKCVGKVKSTIGPAFFEQAHIPRDTSNFELPD